MNVQLMDRNDFVSLDCKEACKNRILTLPSNALWHSNRREAHLLKVSDVESLMTAIHSNVRKKLTRTKQFEYGHSRIPILLEPSAHIFAVPTDVVFFS